MPQWFWYIYVTVIVAINIFNVIVITKNAKRRKRARDTSAFLHDTMDLCFGWNIKEILKVS